MRTGKLDLFHFLPRAVAGTHAIMQTANLIDDLTQRLSDLLASSPASDLERNVRALLSSQLTRLDLVTREEFEVQTSLLMRSQERLRQLEQRVAELERRHLAQTTPHA